MSSLHDLQNQFQRYLLTGKRDFVQSIVDTKTFSVDTRLGIYENGYRVRLINALVNNYPVLHAYLGEIAFEKIAGDYINQFPSCYRSIRWFGDQFANFLKSYAKDSFFLSELAHFEWLQTLVFDAEDAKSLQMEEVAKLPPEAWVDMRFCIHPSVQCISLSWNTVQIWQAVFDQRQPDLPFKNPIEETWLLWRKDLINYFRSLNASEAWAMEVALKHLTFGEMCEGLCNWFTEKQAGIEAALLLKKWIECGILTELKI